MKTSKYRVSIILNSKASSPARVGATLLIPSKAKQAKHCFQETSDEEQAEQNKANGSSYPSKNTSPCGKQIREPFLLFCPTSSVASHYPIDKPILK